MSASFNQVVQPTPLRGAADLKKGNITYDKGALKVMLKFTFVFGVSLCARYKRLQDRAYHYSVDRPR